jgi:H2-forming N5,N10-methylenetetrahydromethanopterin dehydrogenase-like enzyme
MSSIQNFIAPSPSFTSRNMFIFPPELPSPVKSEAQVLEDNVLNIVKNYFNKKKQIPKATIENEIIPKYKYKGNLN